MISSLLESQEKLHDQVMKLIVEKDLALESDCTKGFVAKRARDEDVTHNSKEALATHLLFEECPEKW